MAGTTTKGYPYPTGTDRVMDGDNAIQALATAVDKRAVVSGVATVPQIAAGGTATPVAVTFPVGSFLSTPNVVAQASNSRVTLSVGSATSSGFNIGAANWTTAQTSGPVTVTWLAGSNDPI